MSILAALPLWAQTLTPTPAPHPVQTSITVIGELAAEAPAAVTTLDNKELQETPGVNVDDRLRQVPGFSLFRRTSSLVANPTTQGVSLRGLGSTGASRTLVMWDGIPLNDPFGGWVYWDRVDPADLGRVEVMRSASTSVFGDKAMGGVLSLFSREPERGDFTAAFEAGNRNTQQVSAGFSQFFSRWALSGSGRAFQTDGYYVVPAYRRGPVDTLAGVKFVAGDVRLDYLGGPNRLSFKFDALAEERRNGTVLTTNSTSLGEISANYAHDTGHTTYSILGFHEREQFHAVFSNVNPARTVETLAYNQTVPSNAIGGAAYVQHRASRWNVLAGADTQRVEGYSTDRFPALTRVGGGTLLQSGMFGQGNLSVGPARFFIGVREQWTGLGSALFSPNAGVTGGRGRWRYRGSAYRSYRAPTLNELYREFRVGNTVTLANAGLRPETLTGGEFGGDFIGERTRLSVTAYRNQLHNLISNVTLAQSGNAITRQRQNTSNATAQGVEVDLRRTFGHWQPELSYLYADSRLVTGERIPQVAKNQGSAQLNYENRGTLATIGMRSYSLAFEDDRNQFILPGYATVQLSVRQQLAAGFSAQVQFENILDREYLTGYSPTPLIGAPRLWRAGLRWESGARRRRH